MKYLIYANNYLTNVAKDKQDSIKILENYKKDKVIGKAIPLHEVLKGCENIDEKICRILRELEVDESTYTRQCKHFSIELNGDWKHVHAHCDNIITKIFKCNVIREENTWEDGSDSYGSIHTYCL